MKTYLLYLVLAVLFIAGGAYYMISAKKDTTSVTDNTTQEHAGGHVSDTSSDAQSQRGYNVQVTSNTDNMQSGRPIKLSYKIVNNKGEVLKDFVIAHEKIMHFILVRKDLQNFQHLHPDFNQSTGEFSLNITFPTDGPYRLFPDFTPTPENPQKLPVTVKYDVTIGDINKYKPSSVTPDTSIVKSADEYRINYYLPETLKAQTQVSYSLTVEKTKELVELESYLGAMGHGVILKADTLDFIHTHAEAMDMEEMENTEGTGTMVHKGEPDTIEFSSAFPEPGIYKIFTQFQIKGKVITSDYAVKVE